MRSLLLIAFAVLTCITASSQAICGFDEVHHKKMLSDPSYRKAVEENEKAVQKYIIKNKNKISARTNSGGLTLYTIPVVVHVMHTGGAVGSIYNPSNAQIYAAIDYLNQVYNGTYPGTQGIGNMQIQFVLAVKDPNCNSTTGIERIDASIVSNYAADGISTAPGSVPGVDELRIKNLSRWDPTLYYNIWVVDKIDGQDGTSGAFNAGYAYLPGVPPPYDGTVMLATQMVAGQKTLPHEIGHAFGLYHTFQGSADNNTCPSISDCAVDGDAVCDTDPETFNQLNGVYDFSCRTGINPCTGTPFSINTENNYMNYTNCYNLFTAGQKARLLAFAASAYRKSLSTSLASSTAYPIASFSPPVNASCTPVTSSNGLNGGFAGILNVEVNNRSLGSSLSMYDNGYVDGTSNCLNLIQLVRGSNYTISATVAGIVKEQLKAWIDFNSDGVFSASEEILSDNSIDISSPVISNSFTVPLTAPVNRMLRLRIVDDLSNMYQGISAITDGCYNPVYGQAEDYPVYISGGVLPVTLSDFTGLLKNNSVVLSWNTSFEQSLKSFEIEKSMDGVHFKKIGSVNGAGESSSTKSYTYTDNDLLENNYYRLRMNDMNGASKLSEVVRVHCNNAKQKIWVVNNPFNTYIELRFDKVCSQVNLQLINSLGVVVTGKTIASPQGLVRWDTPMSIPQGHYVVKAIADGEMFTSKLVKQ